MLKLFSLNTIILEESIQKFRLACPCGIGYYSMCKRLALAHIKLTAQKEETLYENNQTLRKRLRNIRKVFVFLRSEWKQSLKFRKTSDVLGDAKRLLE